MVVVRCLILCSKFSKKAFCRPGSALTDPLGELTALPRYPGWIMGKGEERGGGTAGGEGG